MSTAVAKAEAVEAVLIQGDLKALNAEQRLDYYQRVCHSLNLNPLTRPFEYLTFQGRLILYARRDATEQLRRRDGVSITIVGRKLEGDVYTVSARAKLPDGREDESDGAVCVSGLKGDALANAYMKAETKAKRRVTLSICGLGMLDETEVPEPTPTPPAVTPTQPLKATAIEPKPDTDPVKSAEALDALLRTKGKARATAFRYLSGKVGVSYPPDFNWLEIPSDHRALLVDTIRSMPDAAPVEAKG